MLNSSKIAIGTAQFELPYGVTNISGVPSRSAILNILNYCYKENIKYLDTAYAYGAGLSYLPYWDNDKLNDVHVIQKFNVLDDLNTIRQKIISYKSALNIKKLYALLIHDPQNINKSNVKQINTIFEYLIKEEHVEKVGVSLYEVEDLPKIINELKIDIVQAPINIFQQCFLADKITSLFKANNIELHARSLFLQGVLLTEQLPLKLYKMRDIWERYMNILAKNDISPLEACISFLKSCVQVNRWVIGVTNISELAEINRMYQLEDKLDIDLDVFNDFSNINKGIIDPRNW